MPAVGTGVGSAVGMGVGSGVGTVVEGEIRSMSVSPSSQGRSDTVQVRVPAVVSSVAEDAGSERDTEPSSSMKSSLWPEREEKEERESTTEPLRQLRAEMVVDVPLTEKEAGFMTPLDPSTPTPDPSVTGSKKAS